MFSWHLRAQHFPLGISRLTPAASPEIELDSYAAEPLEFRERRSVRWLMALVDVGAAQVALALGVLARQLVTPWMSYYIGSENYRGIVLGLSALPVANSLMGLYPGYGLGPTERLRRRLLGASVTFAGLAAKLGANGRQYVERLGPRSQQIEALDTLLRKPANLDAVPDNLQI
jgi:hypothetical protein